MNRLNAFSVMIIVTSPVHSTFGATAVNVRRIRSGAVGRLPCPVGERGFFGLRPAKPSSAIRLATVFSDTRQPLRAGCPARGVDMIYCLR